MTCEGFDFSQLFARIPYSENEEEDDEEEYDDDEDEYEEEDDYYDQEEWNYENISSASKDKMKNLGKPSLKTSTTSALAPKEFPSLR